MIERGTSSRFQRRPRTLLGVVALVVVPCLLAGGCSDSKSAAHSDEERPVTSTTAAVPSGEAGVAATIGSTVSAGDNEQPGGDQTEPAAPGAVSEPVGLDQVADFGGGVSARIASVESIAATAQLPGEKSGPAIVVTLEVLNGSAEDVALNTVTVDLTDSAGLSAAPISTEPALPFTGNVAPGATATGRYVFTLAPDQRTDARISVRFSTENPTVAFSGRLPGV